MRVALVSCSTLPDADTDSRLVIGPLADSGIETVAAVWDDPAIDWTAIDLAIVRSCWDYVPRRDEFLAWAHRVPTLANPAGVIAWNTDKRYLLELAAAGIPFVPTTWLEPQRPWTLPEDGLFVVKPAISISSLDTGRYRLDDEEERRLAHAHVDRLHAEGRTVMIQPYQHAIDDAGETSLIYFRGVFSHAMTKGPVLKGPDEGADHRFVVDGGLRLHPADPASAQRALAERTLAAVKGGAERLLYARVDLVPGPGGSPILMELELTEPMLYLSHVPAAPANFAAAITRELEVRSQEKQIT